MSKPSWSRMIGFRGRMVTIGGLGALIAFAASAPLTAVEPAQVEGIPWQTGTVILDDRPANELRDELTRLGGADAATHVVVRARRALVPAERAALAGAGVTLLRYVGDRSFFASLEPGFDGADAVAALELLGNVTEIDPTWKLHRFFVDEGIPTWAIVDRDDGKGAAGGDDALRGINPTIAVYVLFHADVEMLPEAWMLVARHGGRVQSELHSVNGMVVELPYLMVEPLAASDIVQYVEPALPKLVELNDSNRDRVGAGTAQALPYGLDGAGVSVLVYDGGFALDSHSDFGGRLTVRDSAGLSDHATHVSGTIGGDGTGSAGQYRGMAPAVTIESYGFEQEGGLSEGFLYTDPGDMEADYGEAINVHGADISNNSIGTNTATNGFPCDWTGNYGVTSTVIDSIVGGSLSGGTPFRIVWANGNERQTSRCNGVEGYPGEYHTTAPPACAKNHITVGALNSNDDSMTSFSSWGPADDGRLKPDISAPGCQSDDDFDVTSCSSSGGYTGKCGTSMASPTVAGISALLLQDHRLQFPADPDFRNSTLKVLLAHTAVDLGNVGPDYQFGYGSVRIVPAIDHMRSGSFLENEVGQAGVYSVLVVVNPGDPQLKVTLAWDDVPGTPNVDPALVNDLDLEVFDPSGVRQFPWTLDPLDPALPAVQNAADHLNNIEQVVVDAPAPGVYRVDVVGFNVPQGPQSFSLTASPTLIDCSSTGVVSTDRAAYACESVATVRVVDCDLNTDDGVVETVSVTVASTSEPGGESLLLTETGPETSAFEATIALSQTDGPGVLLVADGDSVTSTYVDADDGMGGVNVVTADVVPVDCQLPMAVSITTIDIEPRSATVQIDASEPVQATVRYGTNCALLDGTAGALAFASSHSIGLANLEDDTTYFYAVDLVDQAGNMLTDDDGGACYTFTTPEVPDFFTEQFGGGVDLDGLSITFTPNVSVDAYAACATPIVALPTDPAGGTVLSLSDDGNQNVALGGGAMVQLYGVSYGDLYVNANGNITFGASDGDYTESLGEHFDTPRVSGLWDDLNPSVGGTVSWKQEADRVAVTWEGVPEYSTSNSNTFQIELFFDGTIQVSYLGLDSGDAICGLSEGLGLSPDFFASDLSASGSCGPMPPSAAPASVQTAINTEITIGLVANDDGLPDPPAALTYVITSLPAYELRDAGTDQVITAGQLPYTLDAGGNAVIYRPFGSFQGLDGFGFAADDGGVPPDGGQSGVALVDIQVGGPQQVYLFPFDDNEGWFGAGGWAFGQPTGGGTHDGDPTSGFTGTNVWGFNLSGDYPDDMATVEYLRSSVIDCSTVTGTELRFRRWLGVESATFDHAIIEITNDNVNYSVVWEHTGGTISESSWSQQVYDISAIADGAPSVVLRWGMGPTDGVVSYPGWNIDDVEIWGNVPFEPGGDVDGDGDVDIQDLLALLAAWGACPGCPEDINGDGMVDIVDLLQLLGEWGSGTGAGTMMATGGGTGDDARRGDTELADDAPLELVQVVPPDPFVNDGVLAPLDQGGLLEIDRDYLQTERGVLVIEIAGTRPGDDYDVLVIDGTATLDGVLEVRLADELVLEVGDRFVLVAADRIVGEFTELHLPDAPRAAVEVRYGEQEATLHVLER